MNDPRGSIWQKWDLHVHTPASFHWNDGMHFREMTDEQKRAALTKLVLTMQESDVTAFGVMDYWTFDGYLALIQFLKDNPEIKFTKAVFPGMELRIESPTEFRLNIHVLLTNSLTVQNLLDFKSALKLRIGGKQRSLSDDSLIALARSLDESKAKVHGLTSDDLKDESNLLLLGSETAEITRDSPLEACKCLPAGNGLIILPYDTADGFAKLDWKTHSHSANEFLQAAHIFETRNPENSDLFLGRVTEKNRHFIEVFQKAIGGAPKPVVSGSDAHRYTDYGNSPSGRATWMKADPTWEGLASVMYEPLERSYIGVTPPPLERVSNNRTLYIKSLEVKKVEDSDLGEAWFDKTQLPLNHGLVAIIGNKGSGKSALTDIIGLLGNSKRQKWFPFLNSKQFRQPGDNKARHFQSVLTWESDATESRKLDEDHNPQKLETVNYIPQGCFEDICNELASAEESNFDKELKSVIFSHVASPDRLGKATLDELIEFKTNEIERGIELLRKKVERLNQEIINLEDQSSLKSRKMLEEQLKKEKAELDALENVKPPIVQKPKATTKQTQELHKQIKELKKQRDDLEERVKTVEAEQEKIALLISKLEKVLERFSLFQKQFDEILLESKKDLQDVGIDINILVDYKFDSKPILDKRAELKASKAQIDALLDLNNKEGLIPQMSALDTQISNLRSKLDEPSQSYHRYEEKLRKWKGKRREIVGTKSSVGSLKYYENKLSELDTLPDLLSQKRGQRVEQVMAIHEEITRLTKVYSDLYGGVQSFIRSHPLGKEKFNLVFDVSVINVDFQEQFFECISHGVMGSFCGVDEGKSLLREFVGKYDFSSKQDTVNFLDTLMTHLNKDIRTNESVSIESQLRKGQSKKSLYNFIYSLRYLKPRYILKMGDRELSELSPGEKGTLLLVFYLLVDRSDAPLVIDQPEHNLDNETIYDLLVPAIKEAKQRRQIIIVTHNPNIAVVSDADQIICAYLDKANRNKVDYVSGSIENPQINKRVVDVLEGTIPAFDNRGMKYTAARLRIRSGS